MTSDTGLSENLRHGLGHGQTSGTLVRSVLKCFQRQADPMILVKNRLGKFYEQISWENFTNVREIFTNVWEISTNVWQIFTNVWEIATNVWETPCPGKIVSVMYFDSFVGKSNQICEKVQYYFDLKIIAHGL